MKELWFSFECKYEGLEVGPLGVEVLEADTYSFLAEGVI